MRSDLSKTLGRCMHHILSGNSVEVDVKKTSRDGRIFEVIVDVHKIPCGTRAELEDVRSLDRHDRVSYKARWRRQHLCCNSLHCNVEPQSARFVDQRSRMLNDAALATGLNYVCSEP